MTGDEGTQKVTPLLPEIALSNLIERHVTLDAINTAIERWCGVRRFFADRPDVEEMRAFLSRQDVGTATVSSELRAVARRGEREHGDVQTDARLARSVCALVRDMGARPRVVIEPTCGSGAFLCAALEWFGESERVYGIELQRHHVLAARVRTLQPAHASLPTPYGSARIVEVHHDDVFTHSFGPDLDGGEILILGNPPWITSAELGRMGARTQAVKWNQDGLRGMEALTGRSNFDMAEAVICRMLDLFSHRAGMLAMLCKNVVIRRIVEMLPRRAWCVHDVAMYAIDAGREFGVAVDASLLVIGLGERRGPDQCHVAGLGDPHTTTRVFGWHRDRFVADVAAYDDCAALDGESSLEWRQGIKHDCARVMELRRDRNGLRNGDGEPVDVEPEHIFPLMKSSSLARFCVDRTDRELIVPQRHIGDATDALERSAPKLWRYLRQHRERFAGRRSKVYRSAPEFAIFGVGDYSFRPYKVAVSGLYKTLRVALVPPIDGRPVMFDDTCYVLGFEAYADALFTATLLHHRSVRSLLGALVFHDAKRPYTKSTLMRINLAAAARTTTWEALCEIWALHDYVPEAAATRVRYDEYCRWIEGERC